MTKKAAKKAAKPKKPTARPLKQVKKKAAPRKKATPVKPGKKSAKLSARHRTFITAYLANGFNGTAAVIEAGYSKRSAATQASRLLAMPAIKAAVGTRTEKALAKREINATEVLGELAKLAYLDPRKLFRGDGSLVPIVELPDDCAASIAGVEVIELFEGKGKNKRSVGFLKKIKFADKGQNLERLGRHLKLFTDKIDLTAKIQRVLVKEALTKKRPLPPAAPEFE